MGQEGCNDAKSDKNRKSKISFDEDEEYIDNELMQPNYQNKNLNRKKIKN